MQLSRPCRLAARLAGSRRGLAAATGGKAVASAEEAVKDIASGSKLLVGGFGLTGVPENLLRALDATSADNLTVVSSNVGTAKHGLGPLFASKKISKVIGSYVGENEVRGRLRRSFASSERPEHARARR